MEMVLPVQRFLAVSCSQIALSSASHLQEHSGDPHTRFHSQSILSSLWREKMSESNETEQAVHVFPPTF
jgi:hypothetical protein